MTQRFENWSEDRLERVKRMKKSDQEKYAEEALHELNEAGLGKRFWKSLEDEDNIFSPANERRRRKAHLKAKRRMRKKEK